MQTYNDVHQQFASYFNDKGLRPYLYLLSRKLSEGNICLNLETNGAEYDGPEDENPGYESTGYETLPDTGNQPELHERNILASDLVATEEHEYKPFVWHNQRLYMQRYFHYESLILERILAFLEAERQELDQREKLLETQRDLIVSIIGNPSPDGASVPDWQTAAVITGLLHNFTIITGGPGTGKTTTVARILSVLYTLYPGLNVALAAPTGKAAARMAESLRHAAGNATPALKEKFAGLSPSTIHRLLKPVMGTPYFQYNAASPLTADVVIVDECSMIDVALFAKLLDAVGPHTRIILLGDKDQLASVEAGSLFGDLCEAQEALNLFSPQRFGFINSFIPAENRKIPPEHQAESGHPLFQHLVELRHSHRFDSNKGIGRLSAAVIQNDIPIIKQFFGTAVTGEIETDTDYSQDKFHRFIEGYADFIREPDIRQALRKLNRQRVLCAIRQGNQGLYAVNRSIERFLHEKDLVSINTGFYENRPVMLSRNYYEFGLFNGDTGIIRKDPETGSLAAWFEDSTGELKSVLPGYLGDMETAFAMTIHKSQGSEFDHVMLILPLHGDMHLLTRELLYTGITRAKKSVLIQSQEAAFLEAAARRVERASGIAQRLISSK